MPTGNNPIPTHVLNKRRQEAEAVMAAEAETPAVVAGADIAVHPEHAMELAETEKNSIKSFPRYRTMIVEVMKWWQANYPDLYNEIVFEINEEDRNDLTKHYYGATHDLRYDLLDPKWVKYFISGEKKWKDKEKTKQYGYDHPRRYHDAILKCADVSKFKLPATYKPVMKDYLATLKKEKAIAKTNRQLTEQDADEISIGLYEQLCTWAVQEGRREGIFVWAFMTAQCECFA
jgi:hypothetical protein